MLTKNILNNPGEFDTNSVNVMTRIGSISQCRQANERTLYRFAYRILLQ
jgi:hypothetical protein